MPNELYIYDGFITNGSGTISGSLFMTGSNGVSASISQVDYIDFNTGSVEPGWKSGRIYWNNTDQALSVYNSEVDISLQVGQENYVRVYNQTGAAITNGTAVRLLGAHGDVPKIEKAQSIQVSGSSSPDNQIIGLATHDIEDSSIGYVTTQGLVKGINTSTLTEGSIIYVSSSAGLLTTTMPDAPFEVIQVGVCVKSGNGGSGIIFVYPAHPMDFGDLSSAERGVYQYGDIWSYQLSGSSGVWKHGTSLSGSYTITGSLNVARGITGSLFGTSSRAVTASYALTASYVELAKAAVISTTAVTAESASYVALAESAKTAQTASYVQTAVTSSAVIFGPYNEVVPLEEGYSLAITPFGAPGEFFAPDALKYDGLLHTLTVTSSYAYTASLANTASYVLNAVSASRATTASYVLNAVSASFASTASFVNTLNQNVLITGSLTIGTSSIGANENTLVIGPAPAGGTGEGGQILLQAPGGTYTSASMFDNYQNYTRILRGTNAGSDALVAQWNMHTKQMSLPAYNSTSAFSGTVVGLLAFDSSGNVITTTTGSGGGGGGSGTVNSGVAGYLAYYPSTGTTVDDTSGVFWDAGNSRLIVTGSVIASANNSMYFRGGDDAELWDINVANTVGIYGQQDQGVASVKLGSGGGTISGRSGSIGIGTITPNSGSLHVAGNVFANSFTGSFLGTASYALDGGVPYVASTGLTSTTGVPPEEGGPAPVNFSVNLSTGISGGQSVIGGTGLAENLTLSSTTNAGKGSILFGSSSYLESSDYLGINQLIPTSRLHINSNQNSVTQSDANGILLANATAATANTQSISPGIVFQGNGWKTATTAGSQDVRFRIDVLPVQGSTNPSANLQIASNINSAGYRTGFTLSSAGDISILSGSLNVAQNITGSRMYLSSSNGTATGSTLIVYGSGSAQPVFAVQGSQGQLFSVTDSLSGSLFSVNDISGLPILRVLSDSTTLIGNYPTLMLTTTARVVQTTTGSFAVYSLPTGSYNTAFFEYSAQSGSNARAGTIVAFQSGSSVNFTETTTTDFGSTSTISFGVFVTGSNFALTGSCSTANWTIKTIIRGI